MACDKNSMVQDNMAGYSTNIRTSTNIMGFLESPCLGNIVWDPYVDEVFGVPELLKTVQKSRIEP